MRLFAEQLHHEPGQQHGDGDEPEAGAERAAEVRHRAERERADAGDAAARQGNGLDRTPWVENFVARRLGHLERFSQDITRCHVTLTREQASRGVSG